MNPNALLQHVLQASTKLHGIADRLDRISDAVDLPFTEEETRRLASSVATLNTVLQSGEQLLEVEIKRWGL